MNSVRNTYDGIYLLLQSTIIRRPSGKLLSLITAKNLFMVKYYNAEVQGFIYLDVISA